MDTVCERIKVNQGLNIRRIRTASQIKQETLAQEIGVAQQTMSKYENQEVVDEDILNKCAEAMDVPVELLKNMPATEYAPIQYFKDVTFNNAPLSTIGSNTGNVSHNTPTYNYSEKIILKALQDEVERLKQENSALKAKQNKV